MQFMMQKRNLLQWKIEQGNKIGSQNIRGVYIICGPYGV